MAQVYEFPQKQVTLGLLDGNGNLISFIESNDNPIEIQDAITELKQEIYETNQERVEKGEEIYSLNIMPDVESLIDDAKENIPRGVLPASRSRSASYQYPDAIANPLAPGFDALRQSVAEKQEKVGAMNYPINAFASLKLQNLEPITLDDLKSMSLSDAYIRLGKYIGTQKERFAYNRYFLGLSDTKDDSQLVTKKLKAFFEGLFIHTNFKLQKASIPSNFDVLDTVRMSQMTKAELGAKNKAPYDQVDGTGVKRNVVDLTWGTSGLALSPFHSLFVRTDKMQMGLNHQPHPNEETLIPSFYDAVIEEIQYLYNQLLNGVTNPDTGKMYRSLVDSVEFKNNDFKTKQEIKDLLHDIFDEMKEKTRYDRVAQKRNGRESIYSSGVDGDWSKNEQINQELKRLHKILGLDGLTVKVLEANPYRIIFDATLDLLFLYFTKAEIQKCITDNFSVADTKTEKTYLKKLEEVFFEYSNTKSENTYLQREKRAELPPLDLGLNSNLSANVGCEAVTISGRATMHVPNMCAKASNFCQNSCLVVAGQNVVAGASILGNEYEVGQKTKQEIQSDSVADNTDAETSSGEENIVDYEAVSKGKYRITKIYEKDEQGKYVIDPLTQKKKVARTEIRMSPYAEAKKAMYLRRDLFPYQTRNYARKMYVNLMFLREPLAFCKVLVEILLKYAVGMDKSKVKLIEKGFLKPSAKEKLPAYYRLNVYSDVPWEVMFPSLFEIFSGNISLADISHKNDPTTRKFRFGTKDSAEMSSDSIIPRIQFYDYTKIPNRGPYEYQYDSTNKTFSLVDHREKLYPTTSRITIDQRQSFKKISNYHLTFSYSGNNVEDAINELEFNNRNVTFAFFRVASTKYENFIQKYSKVLTPDAKAFFRNIQSNAHFPTYFWGYKVIDGDLYDNRTFDALFRESDNEPQVVGLKWKFVRVSKSYKLSDPLTTPAAAAFTHFMLGEYKYQMGNDTQTSANQLFLVNLSKGLLDLTKSPESRGRIAGRPESLVASVASKGQSDKEFFAEMFNIVESNPLYAGLDTDLPFFRIYYHFRNLQGSSSRNQNDINEYLNYLISNTFVGPVTENGTVINKVPENA